MTSTSTKHAQQRCWSRRRKRRRWRRENYTSVKDIDRELEFLISGKCWSYSWVQVYRIDDNGFVTMTLSPTFRCLSLRELKKGSIFNISAKARVRSYPSSRWPILDLDWCYQRIGSSASSEMALAWRSATHRAAVSTVWIHPRKE